MKTKSYHHGNLKQALIDAGLAILERDGLTALTLRAVAREASVSQTAPYSHFTDKRALLAAIAEEGFQRLIQYMSEAAKNQATESGRLLAMSKGYVRFATDQPALFRLMFGPEFSDPAEFVDLSTTSANSYKMILDSVRRNIEIKDGDQNQTGLFTLAAWSTVHGLACLLVDERTKPEVFHLHDIDSLVDKVVRFLKLE